MKTMLFFNRKYFSFPFGEWPLIIHAVSNVEFHRSKLIDIPSSWLVISRLLVFFVRGLAFKRFIKPRASGRNIVGQLLPTLWDVTCSVSHPVVCCYMFLRVIGSCCAKVESGQTFGPATPNILLFRDRRSVGPKNVGSVCTALPTLLGLRTRISHTWSPKSYGLYPSHDAVQVPTVLGVVASFCTPLPTRTQQQWCLHTTANTNSTTLNIVGANNVGSCCIRLHTTANTNATTLNIVGANNVESCCTRLHTTTNTNATTLNIESEER